MTKGQYSMVVPSLQKVTDKGIFTKCVHWRWDRRWTKCSPVDSEVLLPLLIVPSRNNIVEKQTTPRPHPYRPSLPNFDEKKRPHHYCCDQGSLSSWSMKHNVITTVWSSTAIFFWSMSFLKKHSTCNVNANEVETGSKPVSLTLVSCWCEGGTRQQSVMSSHVG